MRAWTVTQFGKPLERVERPTPTPTGTEVLVRVTRCGVCHSDLHIWEGAYDLGHGKKLDLGQRGIKLPRVMGHEILGEVVAAGPEARGAPIGATRLVYPWLGCGTCSVCESGRENLCLRPGSLGVFADGGYADHVIVPHPRYLVDIDGIDPSVAAPYACSGVTVYSAIKKTLPLGPDDWAMIIGAGGLGLMAVAVFKALGVDNLLVADIDDRKLAAAKEEGARAVVSARSPDALKRIAEITQGGPLAVTDYVGAHDTAELGIAALRKGGRYVIVGLFGGDVTLSLPLLPLRAISITGSYVGNLGELNELIALVKAGKVKPIPVAVKPLDQVGQVLEDLKEGRVVGRVVVEP